MFYIYADGQLVSSSSVLNDDRYAIDPSVTVPVEMTNKAGSFNFTLKRTHYLYSSLRKYWTVVSAYLDDDCIFTGRVMNTTVNNDGKAVYCEGCLAYLNDSVQSKFEKKTSTPRQIFSDMIATHNDQVDTYKQFSVGKVTIDDADVDTDFEATSYSDTFTAITSDLIDRFGGYLQVHEESGHLILDWIKNENHICSQPIAFGKNLVQYSENDTEDNIWSIIYPTASGGEDEDYFIGSVNNGSDFYEVPERVRRYGRIVKAMSFEDVDSSARLLEKTKEWAEKHSEIPDPTITVTAVDLHVLFPEIDKFSLGDSITLITEPGAAPRSLRCSKIEWNLFKPGQTEITLGMPVQSLTDVYFNDRQTTEDRFTSNESAISYNTSTGRSNSGRLAAAEDAIAQNQQNIEINAESIKVNADSIEAVADELSIQADKIEVQGREIDLKASNAELVELDKQTKESFSRIDGEIDKASEERARMATRLTQAEIDINGDEGSIGLKAQTAQIYGDQQELKGQMDEAEKKLDEQGERLNTVQVELDSANDQIRLKADSEYVEGLEKKIDETSITIDGLNREITLKADKITLDGYISELNGYRAEFNNLVTGESTADMLRGNVVFAMEQLSIGTTGMNASLYYRGRQFYQQGITLGAANAYIVSGYVLGDSQTTMNLNHYHKIVATEKDDGTIEIALTTPIPTTNTTDSTANFKIADTKAYMDGVSAAVSGVDFDDWTYNAVTGPTPTNRTITAHITNGKSKNLPVYLVPGNWNGNNIVVGLHTMSTTGVTIASTTVDASSVYNNGVSAGKEAVGFNDWTYNAVTGATPANRTVTANITNGKSNSLSLYLVQGSWNSNKLPVSLHTMSTTGVTIASTTIDASSVYDSGFDSGNDAVTLDPLTVNEIHTAVTNTRTVIADASNGARQEMALYLTQGSWSGASLRVSLRQGSSSGPEIAATSVDGYALYDAAVAEVVNAVYFEDWTYNAVTGQTPSSRTVTAHISLGKSNDLPLFLTKSPSSNGVTVSLRTMSTTGTVIAATSVETSSTTIYFDVDESDASSNVITARTGNGATATISVAVSITSSGSRYNADVTAGYSLAVPGQPPMYLTPIIARASADASEAGDYQEGYTDGYADGRKAVYLTDYTFNAVTGALGASRTITANANNGNYRDLYVSLQQVNNNVNLMARGESSSNWFSIASLSVPGPSSVSISSWSFSAKQGPIDWTRTIYVNLSNGKSDWRILSLTREGSYVVCRFGPNGNVTQNSAIARLSV